MTNKTLTGLEAIEFMKQGGMIIEKDSDEPCILKIEEGVIWLKHPSILNEYWTIEPWFDFSVAYVEYIEPKRLTGWERSKEGEPYYKIATSTTIITDMEDGHSIDDGCYNNINYFSTKEKAEEINFKQMLFRKLQRFSDENGGNEIDWNDKIQYKHCIVYDYERDNFRTGLVSSCYSFGQVYFISEEVAQQAIELFHDDLIKYFTM